MRSLTLFLLLAAAASSPADELDLHRAAVLDRMIRELAPRDRAGIVFVRQMEHCWTDEGRHDGCVDLSDEAMQWLRARGHGVDRVPEESRYYIHGHPSEHKGTFNPPHPDWLYLPIYTPAAERRTYCEVALIRGLYPDGAVHIRGSCRAAPPDLMILVSGDFLVRQQGETFVIEPFTPPPDCVLPRPVEPDAVP